MNRSRILPQSYRPSRLYAPFLIAVGLLAGLAAPAVAQSAENTFTLYLGASSTAAETFSIRESVSTDLEYSRVGWDAEPFEDTPYFGLRFTRWLGRHPRHGWSIDFTHAKALGRLDTPVGVNGVREGAPVDATEILGDSFDALALDGLNSLIFNYQYRWLTADGGPLSGVVRPYLGIGTGPLMPGVEVTTDNSRTDGFEYGGFGFQFLAGLDLEVTTGFSINFEYKFLRSDMKLDLDRGGAFNINADTNHFLVGFNFSSGRPSK